MSNIENLAKKLFKVWQDCDECQYNTYVCSDHQRYIEPILKAVCPPDLVVVNFQVVKKVQL